MRFFDDRDGVQFKAILPRGMAALAKANAEGAGTSGAASESREMLGERRLRIVEIMLENPSVTTKELVVNLGVSQTAAENNIAWLKTHGHIRRKGGDRGGR